MKVLPYLDDWLICALSRDQAIRDTSMLLQHVSRLGLKVNLEKSSLVLSQQTLLIGISLDITSMTTRQSPQRVDNVLRLISLFRANGMLPYVLFLHLLGKLTSLMAFVPLGLLSLRPLQRWLLRFRLNPLLDRRKRLRVSSQFMVLKGVSLEDICAVAYWSSPCKFSRFYNLDVTTPHPLDVVRSPAEDSLTKTREMRLIHQGLEDEMEVWGYRPCLWKRILVGAGAIFSGGLLLLLLYWLPEWGVKATCTLTSLREAQTLLLRTTDDFRQWFHAKVRVMLAPGKTPFESVYNQSTAQLDEDDHKILQSAQREEHLRKHANRPSAKVRYFTHHSVRYYWNEGLQNFESFKGLEDMKVTCAAIHTDHSSGITKMLQDYRVLFFGENVIDVKVPPLPKLFVKEVFNPFYIFQLFSVTLWIIDEYMEYALSVLAMSIILITTSLYTIRKHYVTLHNMVVAHFMVPVSVCRGNEGVQQVMSTELAPGDVITIPANGMIMPCDAALICGTCTVDESMLTGESVPVTKNSVPSSGENAERVYNTEEHKQHTLFCGSHVIQSRNYAGELVKVVVVRTGFSTEKGQLIRSILYPKPTNFKLHRHAKQFLLWLVGVALIGVIYTVTIHVVNQVPVAYIVCDSLILATIALPVILPVALTAGLVHAQRRMKRVGIFCICPQRINISGQLNLVCFDKTGTLTEDSLDIWGIQKTEAAILSAPDTEMAMNSLVKTSFFACMATCHSLTTIDGKLCGDPLDVKMFSATGSILEEARENQTEDYDIKVSTVVRFPDQSSEFGIVRQFPFCATLQRMSVVVRQLGQKHLDIYLKGAPETVVKLCKPLTVPQNFTETLESYTRQGFRVIALAHHQLESELSWSKVKSLSREQIETNMNFLGLIIMQNKIKEQTACVLRDLQQANIRTLMVTGDNMLTAISVARDCGMIEGHEKVIIADAVPPNDQNPACITWCYSENPVINNKISEISSTGDRLPSEEDTGYHFAVSGQAFAVIAEHFPQLVLKFLLRATVCARMTPDQKTQMVQALQSIDYTVGMCGDGANDCGALKKAHSGIALSELEASVASPFTSTIPNISCVPNLIREGRAALVTSFCVFKFMAVFSLIMFFSVTLMYSVEVNFVNLQFMFIDFGIGTFVTFTMSLNPAWNTLTRCAPPTSLLSGQLLFSILSQTLNCLLFQFLAYFLVQQQSWYQTPKSISCNGSSFSDTYNLNETEAEYARNFRSFENTSIFYVSSFQYLIVAIVFSQGKPFRQPSYKNCPFIVTCSIQYAFLLFIMLNPIPAIDYILQIACIPYDWRITLLIIVLAHAIVSFTLEKLIHDALWRIVTAKMAANGTTNTVNTLQMVNNPWGSAFLFRRQNRLPKTKYKFLALKLQDEADWPPAPSSVTFANTAQYHSSVRF
ncbi:polyamine-transporting ATPase 13A3-like [Vanacampus margaritifer]